MLARCRWFVLLALLGLIGWLTLVQQGVSESPPARPNPLTPLATTVRNFGAVGNGETDDTDAIRRAVAARVGAIRFPAGVYRISETITVPLDETGFTSLIGDGVATIVMSGAGPAFHFVGTHGGTADPASVKPNVWQKQRMPLVEGLEIIGSHSDADGLQATGTMQLTITRTNIRHVRHAIHLTERNRNVIVSDCHLYENRGVGIFYDNVNLHQSNISACHISYNRGGGVVVRGGDVRNIHINGCDIEGNMSADSPPTANVLLDCSTGTVAEVAIVGCTIQHESKAAGAANIRILGTGFVERNKTQQQFNCGHVTIGDNVLSDVKVNVELRGARGVTLVGNTFWQGYEHNLLVEDCSHVVVGANVMERNPLYGYTSEANNTVLFRNCRDCTVNGLHLHQVINSRAGLTLENCERMHVINCTILDCENAGLLLDNVRHSRIANCFIRDDRNPQQPSTPIRAIAGGGTKLSNNDYNGEPDLAGD